MRILFLAARREVDVRLFLRLRSSKMGSEANPLLVGLVAGGLVLLPAQVVMET